MGRKSSRSLETEIEISDIWVFFPGDNLWVSLVGQLSEMENSQASKWANPTPKNKASHDAPSENLKYAKSRTDEAID